MAQDAASKNIVYSVEKAFKVLQAFGSQQPELTLAETARRAGVDNATAFRMLNTLIMLGYVEKVADTKRFRLTLKCLDLGFNAISRMDLRTVAQPVLQTLVADGAGAASIGILDRGDVVYIERMQFGITRLAVDIRVGTRIPAFSSAIGRAILAQLPVARQRAELESAPRPPATPYTVVDLDALLSILSEVKVRGLAVVDQESIVGLVAMAAPVLGMDMLPIAAVSLATASTSMPAEDFVDRFGPRLKDAAQTLSTALQASGGIVGGP